MASENRVPSLPQKQTWFIIFSIEMVLILALPMTIAPDAELLHLPTSIPLGRCSRRARVDRFWPGQTDDCQSAWLLVR